jgi:hypothetical protein
MIKILGKRVVLMLVALVLVNGGIGYGLYEYLIPMRVEKERELAGIQGEIEARRNEVAKLKEEFVLLQLQLREFKQLEVQGFFNNQNRVKAQDSFDSLRQLSGLLKTRYDIKSGELVQDPMATAANYVVVHSPVTLEMDSLDDTDVYTFIKGLQEKFPGSVDLTRIQLTRTENITAPILREIGSGKPVKMVGAKVEYSWRTMANSNKLEETDRESRSSTRSLTDPPEPVVNPAQPAGGQ